MLTACASVDGARWLAWCERGVSMRTVSMPRVLILAASIAMAIVGCTRSSGEPANVMPAAPSAATPEQTAVLLCPPGFRLCTSCRGTPICSLQCPVCPPPSVAPERSAALTCPSGQKVCLSCTGQQICSRVCPECPPPPPAELRTSSTEPTSLTCKPPQHQCVGCTGGLFCSQHCPECAPQAARGTEPTAEAVAATPTCLPPQRQCLDCTGRTICARFCPRSDE